jgi:hypothetical protein
MATQDYAASIQGVSIRVTRLDAAGTLLNNPGDSYTTSAFMRVSFTPEYEEGDEIVEKSANGTICVSYKAPDTMKRVTMELAICEPDPELTNLLSGGLLLRKNMGTFAAPDRKSIGWAAPAVGDDPAGNGVAIECWSFAVKDGKRAASLPYFHWVFPYARLRQSGDRVIENGMMASTFEGYALGNLSFGNGLDDRWEFPVATERPYSYARASWAPTGKKGFYEWHGDLAATISNSARSGSTATITTSTAHGFRVGDSVTIAGTNGNSALHGTYAITAVPTTTTFTYTTTTTGTITSAADTGTALVTANSWDVTDFLSEGSTTEYNTPGNKDYNADEDIDFIIASTEDPAS